MKKRNAEKTPHSASNLMSVLLRLRRGFFWFLALAVLLRESLNAAGGVDELLFSRIEWMTIRTNFDVQVPDRGTGLKCIAANARHDGTLIFWMNTRLHQNLQWKNCAFQI